LTFFVWCSLFLRGSRSRFLFSLRIVINGLRYIKLSGENITLNWRNSIRILGKAFEGKKDGLIKSEGNQRSST